jgi:hypothetical protein
MRQWKLVSLIALLAITILPAPHASATTIIICVTSTSNCTFTFDENGNGAFGPGALAPDPALGGLSSALTYQLPFAVVPGDVLLTEPGGGLSDVVRFNLLVDGAADDGIGSSTLVFYSDNADGKDALADTGFPSAPYPNLVLIPELGPEGDNGAFYTPGPGQPGFPSLTVPVGVDPPQLELSVTYHFISDVSVPEPATLLLLTSGLVGISLLRRR